MRAAVAEIEDAVAVLGNGAPGTASYSERVPEDGGLRPAASAFAIHAITLHLTFFPCPIFSKNPYLTPTLRA